MHIARIGKFLKLRDSILENTEVKKILQASLGSAAATSYNNAILNNSGHCGIIHSTAEW